MHQRTSAAQAFIRVGDFQSEEVREELAVPCSQPEDGDLLGSVQLVDMVYLRSLLQRLPPWDLELASHDGFGFSV